MDQKPVINNNGVARPAPSAKGSAASAPGTTPTTSTQPETAGGAAPPALAAGSRAAASVASAPLAIGIGSSFSRPPSAASGASGSSTAAGGATTKPKMVFKPTIPARKVKQEAGDVKPVIPAPAPTMASQRGRGGAAGPRGRGRGRGRGGPPGAGQQRPPKDDMIASGPFAMGPAQATRVGGRAQTFVAVPSMSSGAVKPTERKPMFTAQGEEYSDPEDNGVEIIDMEVVPEQMGESAPHGLLRDRSLVGPGATETDGKKKKKKIKTDADAANVKDEPMSPSGPRPPRRKAREDDTMLEDDGDMDVDSRGMILDSTSPTPEVEPKSQLLDLSEDEEEEEEEDLTGDFVAEDGFDNPEDKLYLFQFPDPFPDFVPHQDYSLLQGNEALAAAQVKADPDKPSGILRKSVKFDAPSGTAPDTPNDDEAAIKVKQEAESKEKFLAELRARESARKPEGRVGTLVVMKSGKVKMVMGDGIVMDVTAGVPTTFVQQIVHLDQPTKTASVLGEVHKTYVITPDIDRLLGELSMNGGVIPGEMDDDAQNAVIKIE